MEKDINKLSIPKVRELARSEEVILITAAGERELASQAAALEAERKRLEHELGETAIDYPDLRENATYDMISAKLNHHLPRQTADLRELKFKSRSYKEKAIKGRVTFNSVVELEATSGQAMRVWLAGPVEAAAQLSADGAPALSYLSPLGQELWGAKIGEQITVKLPGKGRERIAGYEVISCEPLDATKS